MNTIYATFSLALLLVTCYAAILPKTQQGSMTSTQIALDPTAAANQASLNLPLAVAVAASAGNDDSPIAKLADKVSDAIETVRDVNADVKEKLKSAVSDAIERTADAKESAVEKINDLLQNTPGVDDAPEIFDDINDDVSDDTIDDVTDDADKEVNDDKPIGGQTNKDNESDEMASFLDILDSFRQDLDDHSEQQEHESVENRFDETQDILEDLMGDDSKSDSYDNDRDDSPHLEQENHDNDDFDHDDFLSVSSWINALNQHAHNDKDIDDDTRRTRTITALSKMNKIRNYFDHLNANVARAVAHQSGTCPVYPVKIDSDKVTITTQEGCQIVIRLKGVKVESVQTPQGNLVNDDVDREVSVSYVQTKDSDDSQDDKSDQDNLDSQDSQLSQDDSVFDQDERSELTSEE